MKKIILYVLSLLILIPKLGAMQKFSEHDLFKAATNANIQLVKSCIEQNVSVNAIDEEGQTILHKLPHIIDMSEIFPLVEWNDFLVISLNEINSGSDCSQAKYIEVADYLIKKGADLLIKDKQGNVPLHYCVQYTILDLVSMYIDKDKKSLFIPNSEGFLPSHYMGQLNKSADLFKLAEYIIAQDPSTTLLCARDQKQRTLLHWSIQRLNGLFLFLLSNLYLKFKFDDNELKKQCDEAFILLKGLSHSLQEVLAKADENQTDIILFRDLSDQVKDLVYGRITQQVQEMSGQVKSYARVLLYINKINIVLQQRRISASKGIFFRVEERFFPPELIDAIIQKSIIFFLQDKDQEFRNSKKRIRN